MARDLIEQIPWLGRAALPRVAWVAREVADAGWHVAEVAAWLSLSPAPTRVRRPSAFLAHRLKGAHLVAATPAQRANLVEAWRDRRAGTAPEQQEWEGRWRPPSDPAVQAAFACAMASPGPRTAPAADCSSGAEGRGSQEHDGPSPAEMAHLRAAAVHDPSLIRAALDTCGAEFAARIFSTRLVEVVRSARGGSPGGGRLRLHALTVGTAHP